jgi:hypothetical protein
MVGRQVLQGSVPIQMVAICVGNFVGNAFERINDAFREMLVSDPNSTPRPKIFS